MKASPVPARRIIWLVLGYLIWSAAFVTLYAALSIGCEYGWHERTAVAGISVQRLMLVILFLISLAAAGYGTWLTCQRWSRARAEAGRLVPPAGFLEWASHLVAVSAFAATLATLVPVFFLTTCY
jgi:hypothetical protein